MSQPQPEVSSPHSTQLTDSTVEDDDHCPDDSSTSDDEGAAKVKTTTDDAQPATTEAAENPKKRARRATEKTAPAKPKKAGDGVGKAKKEKTKKLTDSEMEDVVKKWFLCENKPAVAMGLVAALGSKHSKAAIQKALDSLSASGALATKDIKKVKIYFLQIQPSTSNDTVAANSAGDVKEKHRLLKEQHSSAVAEVSELSAQVASLQASKSIDELKASVAQLQKQNIFLSARLQGGGGETVVVTPEEMQAAADRYFQLRQMWIQRKNWAREAAEAFCGEKQVSGVMEELGLEPDTVGDVAAASFQVPSRFANGKK